MEYELVGKDLPEKYENHQDPIFHIDETFELARGKGWVAVLATRGEISILKNGEPVHTQDIIEEYDDDKKLSEAFDRNELEYRYNNWYEIEFYEEKEEGKYNYLDLTADDCVVFSFGEALEVLNDYLTDKKFQEDLQEVLTK